MSRETRKEIIKQIEVKRGSKLISYITSDRLGLGVQIAQDVVSLIHKHILELEDKERSKLDLFLYSRGGQSDVPWTIVSMFREYSKKGSFSVLIPYRAHSAATVIALGADEIIMSKKAELGPIDITMENGPYNPTEKNSPRRLPISVEDVKGYFSLLEMVGCTRPDEKMKSFEMLTKEVHPLALGKVSRLLEETKLVALRLLSTRAKPFSEEENHEIVKRISSEVYSHEHSISRTEAKQYIGLKQVKFAEESNIDEELWSLYNEYKELFQMEEPFNPEEYLVLHDKEENTWTDLNLACIESLKRFDLCKKDIKVKKLRKIPTQVTLNLSSPINLPSIQIPNLPDNINIQQVNEMVQQIAQQVINSAIQQIINDAAKNATEQLVKSLPQTGFEKISFNSGWRKEN